MSALTPDEAGFVEVRRDLDTRRRELMAECGLDAYCQPPAVWLNLAVAAEARGHHNYQRDCERAMDIALERWGS